MCGLDQSGTFSEEAGQKSEEGGQGQNQKSQGKTAGPGLTPSAAFLRLLTLIGGEPSPRAIGEGILRVLRAIYRLAVLRRPARLRRLRHLRLRRADLAAYWELAAAEVQEP